MSSTSAPALPEFIETESALEEVLTRPSPALVDCIKTLTGPLVILGAGGKMGPTLAGLARRAAAAANHPLDVVAVSRFRDARSRDGLERAGVRTVNCDLLDPVCVAALPDAANVIHLVGLKFGTSQDQPATWAMNTVVPTRACERYPRSRIVALSTANVYPLSEVGRGGSVETDPLTPLGEYANATVGRERLFEFYSRRNGTPMVLLRLSYAVELRYGVLVDIARAVHEERPLSVVNGHFNCIWQGDANDLILRSLSLASSPPSVWNLCRPEVLSVRDVANRFGELLGRKPRLVGREAATALHVNASRLCERLGTPATSLETMLRWIAQWVRQGGRDLGRPTHFEVRDGNY